MRRHAAFVAITLVSILAVGCSSAPADEEQGPEISLERTHPSSWTTEGWLDVRTMLISPASESPDADTVVVRGRLVGWRFYPDGDVEGVIKSPDNPGQCVKGWLRLEDRSFIPEDAGKAPTGARLAGQLDVKDRLFYPSSRKVIGPSE